MRLPNAGGDAVPPNPFADSGDDGWSPPRLGAVPPRAPEATGAWLHVVSASSVPLLSRAVFELAARLLAGGHRVLLVDGSPRLRLHERFGRESRWGVTECLHGGLPVLGSVQDTGRLGLYLLAHGTPGRGLEWSRLAATLAAARPHVGRAILALDPDAPAAIGESLTGMHLEGWWPQGGREARRAAGIGGRLGIQFSDLNLDGLLVPRLEALEARVWGLIVPPIEVEAPPAETPGATPAEVQDETAPVHLASDPRVRERLRFLLWMRRVEAEGAASVASGAAGADAPGAS